MNKKLLAIILVIAILIPIVVTTVVLIRNNSQNEPPVNTETNEDTEKDTNKETEKNEPVIVPAFTGKTDLSEERAYLLEVGLLTQMERTEKGNPKTDESGSYLTDESGAIIYESNCSFDYSNVPKNLHVLINYFADKEYSETAIRQIQRFYFYFCESLGKLELFDMLNKIEMCFSTDGTSPELLTQKTKEVFGMENDSGFPYVFKDSKPADEIKIYVNDVKPCGEIKKCDGVCVFNALNSGIEYDRNLQSWLHKITNELTNQGYGEKELVIAQLLFYGSLREVEYRANIVEDIMKCIPSSYEITIDELDAKVREVFSASIPKAISDTVKWNQWVYENGELVLKYYGMTFSGRVEILPDDECKTAKVENGRWVMQSGYGITLKVTFYMTAPTGYEIPSVDAYMRANSIYAVFPEYNFSSAKGCFRNLDFDKGNFVLPFNEGDVDQERIHYIPIYVQDGKYQVAVYGTELWTPAGMLHVVRNSNIIMIDGSIYDEFYVGGKE